MSQTRIRGVPCGKPGCKNKVKILDEKIECEKCKKQYHLECSGFNAEAFTILKDSDSLDQVIWCCPNCRPLVRNLLESIDELENKFGIFDTKINELQKNFEQRFESIETKLSQKECKVNENVENKIKIIEQNFNENNKSSEENQKRVNTLEERINLQNENSDKERRIKNIILYNIPESSSEMVNERIADDCKNLKDIFERKNLKLDTDKIDNIFRLGKKKITEPEEEISPRPLLIKFNSLEYKKEVYKFCKFLYLIKDNVKITISYSHDLTINERKKRKELVEEVKLKNEENNGKFGIRGGKIVQFLKPFRNEAQPSMCKSWAELFK